MITLSQEVMILAEGDIVDYLENNNTNIQIEDADGNVQRGSLVKQAGSQDVAVRDQFTRSIDLYAHIDKVTPTITVDTNIDDKSITVDSIISVAAGDVIIIYEGDRVFQSIVVSAAVNTINIASPLDFAFTTAAIVHVGLWNLAVNGSSTPVIAHIVLPTSVKWDIYQINVSITDNVVMDSAKFGGIAALTNGLIFRIVNGETKNLALVVNNIGFSEQGFTISYDAKAPAGVYGFQARKNYHITNGVSLRLDGNTGDELQCIISDDLGDLTLLDITINGHVVED